MRSPSIPMSWVVTASVVSVLAIPLLAEQPERPAPPPPPEHIEREMDQLRDSIEQLERERDRLEEKDDDAPEVRELDERIEQMEEELERLEDARGHRDRHHEHPEARALERRFEELERNLDRMRDRLGTLEEQGKAESPEARELERNIDRLEREVERLEDLAEQRERHHEARDRELDRLHEARKRIDRRRDELIERHGKDEDSPPVRELTERLEHIKNEIRQLEEGPPHRRHMPPVPAEAILEHIRHQRPELHERLMDLRREDPDRFHAELREIVGHQHREPEPAHLRMRISPRFNGEEIDRSESPEHRMLARRDEEFNVRSEELAERIRETKQPERKEQMKRELRELLAQHFEVRMAIRKLEIKEISRHLDELHERLKRRQERKDELIERRMHELLRPEEHEW